MRGKVLGVISSQSQVGITPAYAGKSSGTAVSRCSIEDHPRLCGEKRSGGSTLSFVRGSPPPMRGKVYSATMRIPSAWITPAYAGKSSKSLSFSLLCRDHPRLCGEKANPSIGILSPYGSPPPMRGKDIAVNHFFACHRITPAYAGKSHRHSGTQFLAGDHPRLCGEKSTCPRLADNKKGSPPPMRGKGSKKTSTV